MVANYIYIYYISLEHTNCSSLSIFKFMICYTWGTSMEFVSVFPISSPFLFSVLAFPAKPVAVKRERWLCILSLFAKFPWLCFFVLNKMCLKNFNRILFCIINNYFIAFLCCDKKNSILTFFFLIREIDLYHLFSPHIFLL